MMLLILLLLIMIVMGQMSLGIVELSKLVLLHFHREMMLLLLLLLMMQRVGVADAVGGGSDRRRSGGKRSSDICDRFHRQGFTESWDGCRSIRRGIPAFGRGRGGL